MDVDGLPIIGPGVDYTQNPLVSRNLPKGSFDLTDTMQSLVEDKNYNMGSLFVWVGAIHQKRTLAFINHFVANTASFLNKFASSCEIRLEKFEAQLQKLEASLSILEAKLGSISSLEHVMVEKKIITEPEGTADIEMKVEEKQMETEESQPESNEQTITVAQDPQYAKFFKMIQFGVPVQAVRLKVQAEGLDPAMLDNPDLPVSKPADPEDSESSFSD